MGGYRSGQWYRWNARDTTADRRKLDIRRFHRDGLLSPGNVSTLTWRRDDRVIGSIGIRSAAHGVELNYQVRDPDGTWREVSEFVFLTWTSCHYGGQRPWFQCPNLTCERRCAILYGVGDYFVCRRCAGLRYESQREDALNRARVRTQTIRRHLRGSENIFEPIPNKPKGMHWSTYERLAEKADLFGERGWAIPFLAYCAKSDAWLVRLDGRTSGRGA